MAASLSVVLPVHDDQRKLAAKVSEILETAGELTERLEVLIVDDGSLDETIDVAQDLAMRYPQVRAIRNATRRGLGTVLEKGLAMTSGELVFVHDGVSAVDGAELRRLWLRRSCQRAGSEMTREAELGEEHTAAATVASESDARLERLVSEGSARPERQGARRRQWRADRKDGTSGGAVAAFHCIDRRYGPPLGASSPGNLTERCLAALESAHRGASRGSVAAPRPNFLQQLTQFVLTE